MEYKITIIASGVVSSYKMNQRQNALMYIECLLDEGTAFTFELVLP